jgi:hypothetical protein
VALPPCPVASCIFCLQPGPLIDTVIAIQRQNKSTKASPKKQYPIPSFFTRGAIITEPIAAAGLRNTDDIATIVAARPGFTSVKYVVLVAKTQDMEKPTTRGKISNFLP